MTRAAACLLACVALLGSSGCAITSKADPIWPHYYNPMGALPDAAPAEARPELSLRLKRVHGADHLKEDMVFRRSDVEYFVYDGHLWTERPENYLRRALERAFYEGHGVRRMHASSAPTLEAELIAFEETRKPSGVIIQVVVQVHTDDVVVLQETFTARRAVKADPEEEGARQKAVAEAMGAALGEVTESIVRRVLAQLKT